MIREARISDAPKLLEYIRGQLPTLNINPKEFRIQTVEQEMVEITKFRNSPNSVMYIDISDFVLDYEPNFTVNGVVTLTDMENVHGEKRAAQEHVAVLGISVLPPMRNKGIGKDLLDAAIMWARESGIIKRIEATSYSNNPEARRFLMRNGFKIEGIRRKAILKDGEYIDAYMLARIL